MARTQLDKQDDYAVLSDRVLVEPPGRIEEVLATPAALVPRNTWILEAEVETMARDKGKDHGTR